MNVNEFAAEFLAGTPTAMINNVAIGTGNVMEADANTKRVIFPGDVKIIGEFEANVPGTVTELSRGCDACGQIPAIGFEWNTINIDDDGDETNNQETSAENICLQCVRKTAMQFMAKERFAGKNGDPLSNLRKEMEQKMKKALENQWVQMEYKLDYLRDEIMDNVKTL